MYLIDDIVYLKSLDRRGVVRDIHELSNGKMYYDIELGKDDLDNVSHHVSKVPESDLKYSNRIYQ